MKVKRRLDKSIYLMILIISLGATIIIGGFWIKSTYDDFKESEEIINEVVISEKKKLVKSRIVNIINRIISKRNNAIKNTKSELENIGDKTYDMLLELDYENKFIQKKQIEIIKKSIPNYFQIYFYNVKKRKLINNGMILKNIDTENLMEEILNKSEKNKDFFIEIENKPVKEENDKQLIFVKKGPYEKILLIFSISYSKIEKELKKDILKYISDIRYQEEGYVFVHNYQGDSLSHIDETIVGTNVWNLEDNEGEKFVQKITKVAKSQGGYIRYTAHIDPKINKPGKKLSYATTIDEWEWVIGTGVYIRKITRELKMLKDKSEESLKLNYIIIFTVIIIVVIIITFLDRYILKRISENFKKLKSFFEKAATKSIKLNTEDLEFEEFKDLAIYVNKMVSTKEKINTDLKKTKREAEMANKAKSQFLANMSHEMRTPLNGIMGLTQLMLMTDLNETQRDYMEKTLISSERLLKVITDTLDISKIELGEKNIRKREFELETIVTEIIDNLALSAQKSNLELAYYISPKVPKYLYGDSNKLYQILMNLLGNGIKFTKKGYVYLEINKSFSKNRRIELEFIIKDTGIGIEREKLGSIFNNFEQGDISYTKEYQGAGLGLSIVKNLVRIMGGEVSLETEVGEGTIFKVYLNMEIPLNQKEELKDDLKDTKILIIESSHIHGDILKKTFNDHKADPILVNTEKEGIEILKQDKELDFVVIEVNPPKIDGIKIAKNIRKNIRKDIKIVLVFSIDTEKNIEKIKKLDVEYCLVKPINQRDIIKRIVEIKKGKKLKDRCF